MTKTFFAKNYKGVREITLQPDGALVVIAGGNGAGKSSFIDAFVELFDPRGTRLTPKPIREGEDEASAEFTDTDLGLRIVRTWKKNDAGQLAVYALDGAKYGSPSAVVAELTGGLIFDPVAFLNLDEKKQRDALLAKVDLPFDLDELERRKAAAVEDRLNAGRDVKQLQGALSTLPAPGADVPDEEVTARAILDEIQAAQTAAYNLEAAERSDAEAGDRVAAIHRQIANLQAELTAAEDAKRAASQRLQSLPAAADVAPLQAKLAEIDEINAAVRAKAEYRRVETALAGARSVHASTEAQLAAIDAEKAAGLAQAEFPVAGLSVDADGITVDGVPFTQVNSAARRRVAFAIATAGNPKLRLVIVKDGDLLDADSLAAIRDLAEERGYTVLVERDRDESRQIGFTIADGALAGEVA